MKKHTKILIFLLCFALSLPIFLSCSVKKEEKPKVEPSKNTEALLELVKDNEHLFTMVVKTNQSAKYKLALKLLQDRFKDQFGAAIPCVSDSSGDLPDKNVIFFGDVDLKHPAIEKARTCLAGDGFAASCAEGAVALYSEDEALLYELCELFSQKYVRSDNGNLTIDESLSLMRSFTAAFDTFDSDFDFDLPVISIDVAGDPVISRNKNYPCRVDISNCYSEQVVKYAKANIRGRGNGSWIYSEMKKSYKLEFDEKVNLLGIGDSFNRDWILLSNPFDYTELRNAIAFTLARDVFTNIEYCTDFAHANVFVDGVYKGVYLICDQPETGDNRIEVHEDPDNINKSDFHIELDSYAESDGYIKDVDFIEVEGRMFLVKSDFNTRERAAFVKTRLQSIFDTIKSGNQHLISQCIDLDSCVDMFLLQEYTKNTDVGWSSFNMVLKSNGKLYFTAPWDIDLSAGNDIRIDNGSHEGAHAEDADYNELYNPIFVELCKNRFFMELVIKRWNETKDKAQNAVLSYVDNTVLRYADEFIYDVGLNYPDESVHKFSSSYTPKTVYHDNMKYMRSWYANRTAWLDAYYTDYFKN